MSTQITAAKKMLKPPPPPPPAAQTPVFGTTTLSTQCRSINIHHLRGEKSEERRLCPLQWKKAGENTSLYLSYFLSDFLVLLQYFETLTEDAKIK